MKLKPPGSDDLYSRIERLEARLNEATRGSSQRDYAKIYIGTTGTLPIGDSRLQNWWYGIPEVDTTGNPYQQVPGIIAKINQPSPIAGNALATWFEVPYGGRWRVRIDAGFSRGSTDTHAAVWVKVNQDVNVDWNAGGGWTPFIASHAVFLRAGPGMVRAATESERVFAQGDHVSFGFWAQASGVTLNGSNTVPKAPTYASIEFMGPN